MQIMLYCAMRNHGNGAGEKASSGTSAYSTWHPRPPFHKLGVQHSPQIHGGQLALFTPATRGQRDLLHCRDFIRKYILFVMSHSQ